MILRDKSMNFIKKLFLVDNIHKAVKEADFQKFKAILQKNPSLINAVDKLGYTPLHWAVSTGNTVLAKFLISKGSRINMVDKFGYTPLRLAMQGNYQDLIRILKSHGGKERIDISDRH